MTRLGVLVATIALLAAACGGDSDPPEAGGGGGPGVSSITSAGAAPKPESTDQVRPAAVAGRT